MTRFVAALTASVLFVVMAFAPTAGAAPPQLFGVGTVKIAGATYGWGDGLTFASRYAKTPSLKFVIAAVRACPNIKFRGYVSTRGLGIVGSAPVNLGGCLPVVGGGPGSSAGCLQAMRTPSPDPYGYSGRSLGRSFVLLAATSDDTCRDLSTQLPGGIWTRTRSASNGVPAGSIRVIKCQARGADGWWDFIAPYSTTLPASKAAVWIPDRYVDNAVNNHWLGVPLCWG